jgi:DNA-binding CsgD family transcriptional regulator
MDLFGSSRRDIDVPLEATTAPAAESSWALRRLLDLSWHAILITDAGSRVLEANERARQLLASRDAIAEDPAGLRATYREETMLLRLAIREAALNGSSRALRLQRGDGSSFHTAVLPLGDAPGSTISASAVVLSELEQGGPPPALLAKVYGFTRCEASLAHLLARGLTITQASRARGISPHTARHHLRRVFDKTGTKRQAELVRVLLLGPVGLRIAPPQ